MLFMTDYILKSFLEIMEAKAKYERYTKINIDIFITSENIAFPKFSPINLITYLDRKIPDSGIIPQSK